MLKQVSGWLLRPLRALVRLFLGLIILFEEWGWVPLHRAMAALSRLPLLRHFAAWLAALPPYAALCVLILPSLLIIPIKLLALWLISQGRALLGLTVIVLAKLVGTALLAWLFHLLQPALMQLPWFVRLYARWERWKVELLAWVRGSATWRSLQGLKRAARLLIKRRWRQLHRRWTGAAAH